ncbi:MAG: adenylyltransferase/cytidyltransferase family protein [Kiritimatiellae bacterium]|nr:adenylyltransferase/cytidyltransferase family protein [Kiritimatiellia bacterium]
MSTPYGRVAYSFVMADLLHYGHIRLLTTARENSDYHICGLISDEACHLWQGINVCNYDERRSVLEALVCVDEVMEQRSMDPSENLRAIRARFPDAQIIVVHGDDWKTMPGRACIESIGATIIQPEYYSQLSRNAIIAQFRGSTPAHPLKYERFTRHFCVGAITQFSPQAANRLLSTKGDTLRSFQSILKRSRVEELFVCTVKDYQHHRDDIVSAVGAQFGDRTVVVRSSAREEDGYSRSNAGRFESVKGVLGGDAASLASAMDCVVQSYARAGDEDPDNQIIVQAQTLGVKRSGVVLTRNLGNNAPYYVVNYDDETGETDTVTGGASSKCAWILRASEAATRLQEWNGLLEAVREIEAQLPGMVLDIEFAEKADGSILVYQIRPLAANVRCGESDDQRFEIMVRDNADKYRRRSSKTGGGMSLWSDMAFWNPSEMIGDNPRPLDYSLYREVITRSAWNRGLVPLGYTSLPRQLMAKYGNRPYINLRCAFRALIPTSLSDRAAAKLEAYYVDRLREDPTAHDKIEFEIVLSCWEFGLENKLRAIRARGFSVAEVNEVRRALADLTSRAITSYPALLQTCGKDLAALESRRTALLARFRNRQDSQKGLECFLELLACVADLGTTHFATIARLAFVAKSLSQSLVTTGCFSEQEMNAFLESVATVATRFAADCRACAAGELGEEKFLAEYGHLRAGTYDIRAPRYDRMNLKWLVGTAQPGGRTFGAGSRGAVVDRALDRERLRTAMRGTPLEPVSPEALVAFMRSAIAERERLKLQFTRALSDALEFLAEAGGEMGFSRDELSFLDVTTIRLSRFCEDADETSESWRLWIEKSRSVHAENSRLVLPAVIRSEEDFEVVSIQDARPNFISQHAVSADIVDLATDDSADVENAIVALPRADPGFDWVFARGIKGLVTKYGGVASHMAIRCAEFDLPAAIGCGERIYGRIVAWKRIALDCRSRTIRPLLP